MVLVNKSVYSVVLLLSCDCVQYARNVSYPGLKRPLTLLC